MVLGRVSCNYLLTELSDGELRLLKLGLIARGREKGRAHFPFFFLDFLEAPLQADSLCVCQEELLLVNSVQPLLRQSGLELEQG